MRLVGDRFEIVPLVVERPLRECTDAEIEGFLAEDRIDLGTAAALSRMLADGGL